MKHNLTFSITDDRYDKIVLVKKKTVFILIFISLTSGCI